MNRGIRVLQTHALPLGYVTILKKRRLLHSKISVLSHVGAEDEARTRYLHLGKVALYQMSYSRAVVTVTHYTRGRGPCQGGKPKKFAKGKPGPRGTRSFSMGKLTASQH